MDKDQASKNAQPLAVDIVSDVVCPWCVIGYLQLSRALDRTGDAFAPSVRWHPFELNPGMGEEGQNLREHLAQKAGITPAQSAAARQRLTALGEELGFTFVFRDDMRIANTFRAHQLLHWSAEPGRQSELKLALFRAYFSEGRNVNDPAVLVAAAESAGLDPEEATAVLKDGRYAGAVRAAQKRWREQELRSVPTFVFNNRFAVMGAQGEDAFTRVLGKLAAEADAS